MLIDINNLSLLYKSKEEDILAIDNINLQIQDGEFVVVLGPSGCGKSTLLKVVAGYLKPIDGKVTMLGEEITGPDWHRGVVFQSPTLYPWMTVEDNVAFGPKMRKVAPAEISKITKHFMEQVNLEGFEDNYTFELSGGMKQRVALARALANYPQMILMDEPFGALDAFTRLNMQKLVRDLWIKDQNTIFLITHDVDEALSLATRIIVMSKRPGKILKEFKVDFTNAFYKGDKHVSYSQEYIALKDEIMDLITSQI